MDSDTKACIVCGAEFVKRYTQSRKSFAARMYCSRACFGKDYSGKYRQIPDADCRACGKTFRPQNRKHVYCSPACAYASINYRRGEDHQSWKGGRVQHTDGYVRVAMADDHPFVAMRGHHAYVLEHRLVMAEHLGRPLTRSETVHHINGDKADNRIENLQLRNGRHGRGTVRACADCGSRHIIDVPL